MSENQWDHVKTSIREHYEELEKKEHPLSEYDRGFQGGLVKVLQIMTMLERDMERIRGIDYK